MSRSPIELGRRHLLVVGGTSAAAACSGEAPGDPPGARADAAAMPDDVERMFLGLDGGIATPEAQGWRPTGNAVDVGSLADFAMGAWHINPGARAIIARDAMGFYAYSALCTHERCMVNEPDATGVSECICHGSRFDGNGRVMRGPAAVGLRHLAVTVLGGRVYVDPTMRVADEARAVPPDPDAGMPEAGVDVPRDTTTPVDAAPDVPRDLGPEIDPCTRGTDVGAVTDFRAGSWTLRRTDRLVVGRDTRGLFAFSAVCTHMSCTVSAPDPDGATDCACHGSRFDGNGRVTRGPASEDLDHYRVNVCAGRVRVDREAFVPADNRTPVP